MADPTAAEVCTLLRTVSATLDVDKEIAVALSFMGQAFAGVTIDAELKDHLALYVAAHLVASEVPQANLLEMQVGPITEKYLGKAETGMRGTRFGQMAIALDTTGSLAALAGELQSEFRVVGAN